MSLSVEIIDAMLESGCTAEQMAAVVKASLVTQEKEDKIREEEIAKKRECARLRKQKQRQKESENKRGHTMSRNVTVTSCDKKEKRKKEPKKEKIKNNILTPCNPPTVEQPETPTENQPTFEDFWKAYPRKSSMGAARRAFADEIFLKNADPAVIVRAATNYAQQRAGEDEKFTKSAKNWLSDQDYLNEDLQAEPSKPMDLSGLEPWQAEVVKRFGEAAYSSWFRETKLRDKVLVVKTTFVRDWIKNHYLQNAAGLFTSIEIVKSQTMAKGESQNG